MSLNARDGKAAKNRNEVLQLLDWIDGEAALLALPQQTEHDARRRIQELINQWENDSAEEVQREIAAIGTVVRQAISGKRNFLRRSAASFVGKRVVYQDGRQGVVIELCRNRRNVKVHLDDGKKLSFVNPLSLKMLEEEKSE
jgi:hydrogenase maturation factor HypE